MNLNLSFLNRFKPDSGGSIWVFRFTGYRWVSVVISNEKQGPKVLALGESTQLDMMSALAEMRKQISGKTACPKEAVLMAPGVAVGLLDLPVEPDKPRAPAQMRELVRWELDNLVGEISDQYSIGAVLVGRGYITHEQRQNTAIELEIRRSASRGGGLTRFGDTAIQLGYIQRDQLDEALAIQEKLVLLEVTLECSWHLHLYTEEDGQQTYGWLACGVSRAKRDQWASAFKRNGLKLKGIFPLTGATIPAIGRRDKESHSLCVEVHEERWVSYRIQKGVVMSYRESGKLAHDITVDQLVDQCGDQLRPGLKDIILVGNDIDSALAAELANRLDRAVSMYALSTASADKGFDELSLLEKASFESIGQLSFSSQSIYKHMAIAAFDPPPPVWKNKQILAGTAAGIVVTAMVGAAVFVKMQTMEEEARLVELEEEFKKNQALSIQYSTINAEAKRLQGEIDAMQEKLLEATNETQQFEILTQRQEFVLRLLQALESSIDQSVTLDQVVEPERSNNPSVHIVAWASNQPAAASFTERFNQRIQDMDYQTIDIDIRSGYGRYGLYGYVIDFWIIPKPVDELEGLDNGLAQGGKR
jgi:outer membrane murein-binding lipoprotein Lpp